MQGRALVQYLTWMRITQSWIPYEQRTAQEQELDRLLHDSSYIQSVCTQQG